MSVTNDGSDDGEILPTAAELGEIERRQAIARREAVDAAAAAGREEEILRMLRCDEDGGPNLDSWTETDLTLFWRMSRRHPIRTARALQPDRRKGYVRASEQLAAYAFDKSLAMVLRTKGQIDKALFYEASADQRYACLPQWVRW